MTAVLDVWDDIAALADYPRDSHYITCVLQCAERATASAAAAAAPLAQFRDRVAERSLGDLQEQYVAAFDVDPACTLEIGWHLFSDGPERGPWLAALREELAEAGVEETGELPDHLAHLLQLIARTDAVRARELASQIAPVVQQIRDRLAARNHEFTALLDAAAILLRSRLDEGAGGAS